MNSYLVPLEESRFVLRELADLFTSRDVLDRRLTRFDQGIPAGAPNT
ncbi:hypothetical protein D8I24_2188 (plasmid) [Cupriavidus necator H850]|nr:hypothetical protein [Cupriavidus necator]KAI3605957.1 hypothetical protein D8I24_2188 [Cupriavidus necator H850]